MTWEENKKKKPSGTEQNKKLSVWSDTVEWKENSENKTHNLKIISVHEQGDRFQNTDETFRLGHLVSMKCFKNTFFEQLDICVEHCNLDINTINKIKNKLAFNWTKWNNDMFN